MLTTRQNTETQDYHNIFTVLSDFKQSLLDFFNLADSHLIDTLTVFPLWAAIKSTTWVFHLLHQARLLHLNARIFKTPAQICTVLAHFSAVMLRTCLLTSLSMTLSYKEAQLVQDNNSVFLIETRQEGQHELTGQRAANFRRDLGAT